MKKMCAKCGEMKSGSEFSPDGRKKDGLYGRCKACRNRDNRVYCETHAEELKESRRKNSKENTARMKRWVEKDDNRFRAALNSSRHHAKKYGHKMCSATIDELAAAFTDKCDACGVPEMELTRKLCVDHSHLDGRFRAFLCGKCNKALGLIGDSEEVLVNLLHIVMNGVKRE